MVGPNILHMPVVASPAAPAMTASELLYFCDAPLAHVVAYEAMLRARRLQAPMLREYRDRERRTGSRARKR